MQKDTFSTSPDGLFMDILGRIDYESDNLFAEMKSKPPYVRAGKNGFSIITLKNYLNEPR
jgi:hypothetical protein